jgi:hypothetical protein
MSLILRDARKSALLRMRRAYSDPTDTIICKPSVVRGYAA